MPMIYLLKIYDKTGQLAAEAPLIVHNAEALPEIIRYVYPNVIPMVAGTILQALYFAAAGPEEQARYEATGLKDYTAIVLALHHPPAPPDVQPMAAED